MRVRPTFYGPVAFDARQAAFSRRPRAFRAVFRRAFRAVSGGGESAGNYREIDIKDGAIVTNKYR